MILKRTTFAIALAIFILAAAASLRYAEGAGLLEAETARRAMQVIFGLMLAAYANIMPKQLGRGLSARAEARAQAALRVGGWSLTLAGLAYAGLWAFASPGFADTAAMITIAAALAVTLGYALWAFTTCRAAGASAPR